jgi:hypothetical protein
MPMLLRYFKVWRAFCTGDSKTAHDRIFRYTGGFSVHFSHIPSFFDGIPHFSQKGSMISGTRDWQFRHHAVPVFPHPPQTGGNSRSIPLQANRYKRYDHGMLFTKFRVCMNSTMMSLSEGQLVSK